METVVSFTNLVSSACRKTEFYWALKVRNKQRGFKQRRNQLLFTVCASPFVPIHSWILALMGRVNFAVHRSRCGFRINRDMHLHQHMAFRVAWLFQLKRKTELFG